MPLLIYPSLQAPVLATGQFGESVTEDRWHQPFSEPRRFARAPGMAIALLASGQFFAPLSIPNFNAVEIWRPWSEPVRSRPGLSALLQRTLSQTHAPPYPEAVSEDRWHQPLSEPIVKMRPHLAARLQQTLALVKADPFPETVSLDRWLRPLEEPVRVRPRLITGAQRDEWLVKAAPFPESVTVDRWLYPFNEPVRLPRRVPTASNPALFFHDQVPLQLYGPDRWWKPFDEPVRLPPRHQRALYHTTALTQLIAPVYPLGPRRRISVSVTLTG